MQDQNITGNSPITYTDLVVIDIDYAIKVTDDTWKKLGLDRKALSLSLRTVHLIIWLQTEVMIGGVVGWLVNMGEFGPDTVEALEAVGAHQCATIVREILSFFPEARPAAEDQERVQQIMAVEEVAEPRWSELGDRLLAWPDDIYTLLQKFINDHEADFT